MDEVRAVTEAFYLHPFCEEVPRLFFFCISTAAENPLSEVISLLEDLHEKGPSQAETPQPACLLPQVICADGQHDRRVTSNLCDEFLPLAPAHEVPTCSWYGLGKFPSRVPQKSSSQSSSQTRDTTTSSVRLGTRIPSTTQSPIRLSSWFQLMEMSPLLVPRATTWQATSSDARANMRSS